MTQGAPRKTTRRTAATAPKTNPLVKPNGDEELDLDGWLAQRGLAGKRRMRVGGEAFEFQRSATPAELTAHNEARSKGDVIGALAALLVDPDQAEAFRAAFDRQRQPMTPDMISDFTASMLNFVVYGDTDPTGSAQEKAGESSAS
ncbi:MAG TPA: hypothetical protein VGL05_08060 [Kribbella sp.]